MAEWYLTKPLVDLLKRQLSPIEQRLAGSYAKPENQWDIGTIVRELDPTYTIPRGIDTLSNVDYGALRDMLLGKYQISKNPRQDLERAGQAALGTVEGIADVSPLALGIKPAIKAAKSLAPEMATMAERYSLDPNMYIVPPEGNLNFRPALEAERIKGPEKQRAGDILRQVQNKPGMTKEALGEIRDKIVAEQGSTNKVMSKQEFEQFVEPSKYEKVDLRTAAQGDIEHYMQEAEAQMDPEQAVQHLGVPSYYTNDALMLGYGDIEFQELDPDSQRILGRIFGIDESMDPDDIRNAVEEITYDAYHEVLYDRAEMLRDMDAASGSAGPYAYEGIQRLVGSQPKDTYFEFGVTHPGQKESYRHYSAEAAPEGLIGHVRGSYLKQPTSVYGGIETLPNSYIVEEIQSDAQKIAEQKGPLRQVHGTLAKAAIQDAVEKGADHIYFPSSYAIGSARARPFTEYESIYDQAVFKEALNPIAKKYGVNIEPVTGTYLMPERVPTTNPKGELKEVPYFYRLEITPEMREGILTGEGQATPGLGMAAGGIVGFDKGGKADKEEYSMPEKINRYVRQSQFKAADLVGLGPEVDFATTIPERYYPADEQHMGRGDAMRHLLLQAQLYKKYGELPAKTIGFLHEMLGGGQTDAEEAMDKYNDILGREIGKASKDRYDMVKRAMEAIENKKARVMTEAEKRESGYAEGGLVYNDDLINQLAEDLFGVK